MNAGDERVDYGYLIEAHTSGDIYVFFRDSNVLAVGDVASPARDPELDYLTGAWIGGRVDAMNRLLKLCDANTQIVQAPGYVMYLLEYSHSFRVIPTSDAPHPSGDVRMFQGSSRGHWEGNTLVVETTNFNDKTTLRYQGSPNTVAVERFTRISPDMIDYRYTITDPTVFTRSWTIEVPLTKRDDKANQIYEAACHEGNYALLGILAGIRAGEKEHAAKQKSR